MSKNFHKMHGCGNDFVIMNYEDFNQNDIKFLCDRKYGIGCDQLILLKRNKENEYDCEMVIYNSNGSMAEFCGNGLRCVAYLLFFSEKLENNKELRVKSGEKIYFVWKKDLLFYSNVGELKLLNILKIEKYKNIIGDGFYIDVGNPHIVFFVKNFDFNFEKIGEEISNMSIFPQKINVNFAQILPNNEILLQTYERGSGLTIACGSGSCATFFSAYKSKLIDNENLVKIIFLKGKDNDFLNISFSEKKEVIMSGPATYVFSGKINNLKY
jgi:diaminopimelate epimerase